jgi:hypothetical protein
MKGGGRVVEGVWDYISVSHIFNQRSFQAQCCNAWDRFPIFEIVVGLGGGGGGRGVTGGVLPFWPGVPSSVNFSSEPVFLNIYGAQESIPRNEFRKPM